jgi:PAS domain-containing protein
MFESIRQKKDGTKFHVLAFGVPITSEGQLVAIYGMYGISPTARWQRKRFKEARSATAPLSATAGSYRALLSRLVRNLRNDAYCRYYQTTPEEILGSPMTTHIREYRKKTLERLANLTPVSPP